MVIFEELEKEALARLRGGLEGTSHIVREVLESHGVRSRDPDRWELEERLQQVLFEVRLKEMPASEFPGGPRTVVRPPDPTPEPKPKKKRRKQKTSSQGTTETTETEEVSISHPSQPRNWMDEYDNY